MADLYYVEVIRRSDGKTVRKTESYAWKKAFELSEMMQEEIGEDYFTHVQDDVWW